uniref:Uncharacterized protein n=1 Tax=Ditylenchus dipsaci TaxID=166011 RepID=A0A915CTZ9_9BILA
MRPSTTITVHQDSRITTNQPQVNIFPASQPSIYLSNGQLASSTGICARLIRYCATNTLSLGIAINCVLLGRIFVKIREESMLAGKTDDFRDYVRRVANFSIPPVNSSADQRFTTKSNNNYLFLNGTQPVFV